MSNQIKVEIYNSKDTADRICNDSRVGNFLALTWLKYFNIYTPMQSGLLRDTVDIRPFKVTYTQPYSHYIWEGIKYIDPTINASGWFDIQAGRWYSHKGVAKIPTGKPLNYDTTTNPSATSHWEVAAQDAFKETVANQVSAYIRRLR